ncbi:MAG: MlaD family protein [Verrucomicrobiota bacterium]
MKKNNFSNLIIAGTVVVCSLVLLGAMTYALTKIRFNEPSQTLRADFKSVTGIKVHTAVRYGGAPVGFVHQMRPLSLKERKELRTDDIEENDYNTIRVVMYLDDSCPDLTEGTIVTMEADTVLAEKFLNLHPGSPDAPILNADKILLGKPAASLDDLTTEGMSAISRVNALLKDLQEKHPDLPEYIAQLVVQAKEAVGNAKVMTNKINTMLDDNEDNLYQSSDKLAVLMKEMSIVSKDLKVISNNAKALTRTLAEKPWRVMWGGETYTPAPEGELLESEEAIPLSKYNPAMRAAKEASAEYDKQNK